MRTQTERMRTLWKGSLWISISKSTWAYEKDQLKQWKLSLERKKYAAEKEPRQDKSVITAVDLVDGIKSTKAGSKKLIYCVDF